MTDQNCQKCRHNTSLNTCARLDQPRAENVPIHDWISANVDRDTAMPPHETPTACPGFGEVIDG